MHRETVENIGNVCLLMAFTFSVYGIVGVNLFKGVLKGRCAAEPTVCCSMCAANR